MLWVWGRALATWRRCLTVFLMVCTLFWITPVAAERLPEFLQKVPVGEIFPNADRYGAPEGKPMVARVYRGEKQLGLVYVTTDVVPTRGYSSKPIDTMIALSNEGEIVGAKLVHHQEPIVLIGIPESKVKDFIAGYIGWNFVKAPPKAGDLPSEMISGATVTLMVINDSVHRSVKEIVRKYRVGTPQVEALPSAQSSEQVASSVQTRPRRMVNQAKQDVMTWQEMLANGAVSKLHLSVEQVNKLFEGNSKASATDYPEPPPHDDTFIDVYVALADQASIGKSLLGETAYQALMSRLKPNQHAIIVAGEGRYSWKGNGYVRGGIFDRIEIIQGDAGFRFTDAQHERLIELAAADAPKFKEVSLFVTPEHTQFDGAEPWRLQLMIHRVVGVNDKAFTHADLPYQLPEGFYQDNPDAEPVEITADTETVADNLVQTASDAVESTQQYDLIKNIWSDKAWHIAALGVALSILLLVFFLQDVWVRYERWYDAFRLSFLTFTLFYIGWYLQAQLSVVNVLTLISTLSTEFSWTFFLMDPMVFILWVFTAVTILLWNRGVFCGWLCPFGALQELSNRIAKKVGVRQLTLPHLLHNRMAVIKYLIFFILLGISFYDLGVAEQFAEIEPFKTAIILKFIREWWFVVFALGLLLVGLFIERFYCRYLCPLGAAIALPSRLRVFDWLRRYQMCGKPCQVCTHECPVQAIAPEGDIHPNECIQCLHCQVMYHHKTRCPQVVATDKKKAKQAAAKASHAMRQEQSAHEQVVHFVKNPSQRNHDKCEQD